MGCHIESNAGRRHSDAVSVESFAQVLHEAGREAVAKNCVVRRDVPTKGFIEWGELDDAAREGRMIQARYILERYDVLGVRTCDCSPGRRSCQYSEPCTCSGGPAASVHMDNYYLQEEVKTPRAQLADDSEDTLP